MILVFEGSRIWMYVCLSYQSHLFLRLFELLLHHQPIFFDSHILGQLHPWGHHHHHQKCLFLFSGNPYEATCHSLHSNIAALLLQVIDTSILPLNSCSRLYLPQCHHHQRESLLACCFVTHFSYHLGVGRQLDKLTMNFTLNDVYGDAEV